MSGTSVIISAQAEQAIREFERFRAEASGSLRQISDLGGKVGGVFASLGAGLSVAAFSSWIKGSIDAADAAGKLSAKTGVAVQDIAGLELAYELAGLGGDVLTTSMSRLSKGMVDGNKTLEALGIKSKNLDGTFKSTKDVMYTVADAFQGLNDGAKKTSLALELFGKSGADMLPLLNGGSEGLREMDEMARKLGLTISEDTKNDAEKFNDTLDLLGKGSQGVARGIAAQLLPTLSSLAGSFLESMTSGDKLKNTASFLSSGLKLLYTVGVGIVEVFSTVGKTIGAAGAQIVAILSGDFKMASEIGRQWQADIGASWADTAKSISAAWDSSGDSTVDSMLKVQKASKALHATSDEVEKQMAAVNKELDAQAKLAAELSGVSASYMDDLTRLQVLRAAQNMTDERYIELVNELIAKQPGAKKAIDETAKAASDYTKVMKAAQDSIDKDISAIYEQTTALEFKVKTYGLLPAAITAVQIAELEASKQSLALTDLGVADIQRKIDALKGLASAQGSSEALDATKKYADEQKKVWESVEQTAHDTFISIFDSGKNAFDRLRDTLKNGLLDLLYQMTVKKWIVSIGASVTGGASGIAQATNTGSSGLSMASNLGSTVSAAGTLMGSAAVSSFGAGLSAGWAGTSVAGAASAYGAAGMSGVAGGLSAGSAVGGAASSVAAGASTVLAAIPVWGWIAIAALAIAAYFDKGGTAHTGAAASASASGVSAIDVHSLGFAPGTATSAETQSLVSGLASGIVGILDSTALAFGKTAGYTAATAFADDTSKDGAWGALLIGKLGETIINWQDSQKPGSWAPKEFADGKAGQAQYLTALSTSVRTALDGIGLPGWAQGMLDGLKDGTSIEEMSAVVGSINTVQYALTSMGEKLVGFAGMSGDAATALLGASGGIEALVSNASAYYDNFYTEGEKAAATSKQVSDALAAVGASMPATREAWREQIEAQMALGAAGAPTVAVMLRASEAFASFTPAAETATAAVRSLADILSEAASLQDQLDSLTMSPTALAAKARGKIDPSNLDLYDDVQIAQGVVDLAAVNKVYLDQLHEMDRATMTTVQLRADDIIGMDTSTIALYDLFAARKADQAATAANAALMESNRARADAIYTKRQSDHQAAEQAAASQAQALMTQRAGMETTLFNLTRMSAEQLARARGLEMAGMDATLRPLQSQIYAMHDQASAAAMAATALENAAASARAVASERGGLQREMYQLTGDTVALRKLEIAALDPANRALKQSIFALQDKMAADQEAAAQAQQAANAQLQAMEEQKRAAEALKDTWAFATSSIIDEVARLRGQISGGGIESLSDAQAKFVIATAQARAQDQAAAKLLPQLSQAIDRLAEENAVTSFDLRLIRAQTASSLQMTAAALGTQFGLAVPSLDVGTNYVSKTGLALIHEGEEITPAAYNNPYTPPREMGDSNAALLAEVRMLRAAVDELRRTNSNENYVIAKNTGETAEALDKFDVIGMPPERVEA